MNNVIKLANDGKVLVSLWEATLPSPRRELDLKLGTCLDLETSSEHLRVPWGESGSR